ncbi:hypothetical protein FA13DRAFT_1796150 [Coprinellus micaceus]|uniref:Uncharacterized protein n=1 Tax=Coprinellus micaceus TaxID=71717 RepID=A0A4Y7SVD6_COPMI|nr:hypothetical protein FA13DRAFT_1796150 [Coprinellus micaceus]
MDRLRTARDILQPHIPLELRDPRDNRRTLQTTRAPLPATENLDFNDDDNSEDIVHAVGTITSQGDVRLPSGPARGYPIGVQALGAHLGIDLRAYIRRFLYDQKFPNADRMGMDVDLADCPTIDPNLHVKIFYSAVALYHAPSEVSGIGGMKREIIRATPSWQRGPVRHDCAYVEQDADGEGFEGLGVAQVQFFLSFKYGSGKDAVEYQCVFVWWFERYDDSPCDQTGLWRVHPDMRGGRRVCSIIHIDTILRSAHLIPVFGDPSVSGRVPVGFHHSMSLGSYKLFYVNRYIDYNAHEFIF